MRAKRAEVFEVAQVNDEQHEEGECEYESEVEQAEGSTVDVCESVIERVMRFG